MKIIEKNLIILINNNFPIMEYYIEEINKRDIKSGTKREYINAIKNLKVDELINKPEQMINEVNKISKSITMKKKIYTILKTFTDNNEKYDEEIKKLKEAEKENKEEIDKVGELKRLREIYEKTEDMEPNKIMMTILLFHEGVKAEDLYNLKWKDFNLRTSVITIKTRNRKIKLSEKETELFKNRRLEKEDYMFHDNKIGKDMFRKKYSLYLKQVYNIDGGIEKIKRIIKGGI